MKEEEKYTDIWGKSIPNNKILKKKSWAWNVLDVFKEWQGSQCSWREVRWSKEVSKRVGRQGRTMIRVLPLLYVRWEASGGFWVEESWFDLVLKDLVGQVYENRLQERKIIRDTTWKVMAITEARGKKVGLSGRGGEKW